MRLSLVAFVLALVLAACVPGEARQPPPEPPSFPPPPGEQPQPAPPRPDRLPFPAYETFDPSGYDAEPVLEAPAAGPLEHDVPAVLMAGRLPSPPTEAAPRTVQGFRIQVFSSENKAAADRARDAFEAWFRTEADPRAFPYRFEATVEFLPPFYRVRGAAFASREEAAAALELVRQRFPEAFLVPSTVTLVPVQP